MQGSPEFALNACFEQDLRFVVMLGTSRYLIESEVLISVSAGSLATVGGSKIFVGKAVPTPEITRYLVRVSFSSAENGSL